MSVKKLKIGDLVWAKMKGFPAWPAKVSDPKKTPKKFHHYVYFFGTKDFAWIADELITPHSEDMIANLSNKKMTSTLKAAVEEIMEAAKEVAKGGEGERPEDDQDSRDTLKLENKVADAYEWQDEEEEGSKQPSIQAKLALKYKRLKESKKAPKKRFFMGRSLKLPSGPRLKKSRLVIPSYGDGEEGELELEDSSQQTPSASSPENSPPPTDKKIGFLGLGLMGQGIVRNLLSTGHRVTVWNRTPDKCDEFVRLGALKAATIADVVAACDVTFCCVGDADASKWVVFGPMGVLRGLELARGLRRGYVELTSLDEQTSQEIAEAVQYEGGRYLEAPLASSTRQTAASGELILLGSGDRALFRDCETCFHAVTRNAWFVSEGVGQASQMSLINSSLAGVVYGAMGEALAMADRMNVPKKDMLDVARMIGFSCPLVSVEEGEEEASSALNQLQQPLLPSMSVKNQQKDLHLAMGMGDTTCHPMPVISATNELYKHAKRIGYQNKDASAIYLASKF